MGARDATPEADTAPPRGRRKLRLSEGRIGFEGFRSSTNKGTMLLVDEVENAIDPNSHALRLWHHVLLVCTLAEAFILPFFLMFKPDAPREQPKELYIVMGCEALFLVDLFVQAHTGFYDDGNIVRDRRKTRKRYATSWRFILDMFTLIPFSYLFMIPMLSRAALEMHKLLRWIKVPKYIATMDDMYAKQFVLVKLIKMIVSTIYLSHFVACFRFSFGYNDDHNDEWLPARPHEPPTVLRQYLVSVFWAFGVMSGLFEGELPTTVPEFIFTLFVAIGGFTLFTALCGMFFMISKCESGNSEAAEARIQQLKHLLSFHHVPENLQKKAVEYLLRFHTDVDSNDREVMKLLCPSIKKDIQVELLKETVTRIALFEGCAENFLIALTSLLELISLPAQSTVFRAGEYGDSMYIVHSGVLNVIVNGVTVREMRKGTCFGELSVFLNSPRTATVVSATYATLYKLTRFHGERLLEGYPQCAQRIRITIARTTTQGSDRKTTMRSTNSSSSLSKFDLKRIDAATIGAKIRQQAVAVPFFSWGKKSSYVLPGLEDVDERGTGVQITSRKTSLDGQDVLKNYYDERAAEAKSQHQPESHYYWLVRKLLLHQCIDSQSRLRMWWLLALEVVLTYNWITIPLRLCFPVFNRPMWYVDVTNVMADVALVIDMYLNFNLSYTVDSEKIMDTSRSASHYLKGGFALDLLSVMPFWILSSTEKNFKVRIPRLLRCRSWYQNYQEVSAFFRLTNRGRLVILCMFLVLLYHAIACAHFGVTNIEGFSDEDEAWLPTVDIFLEQINDTHYYGENGIIYSVEDSELSLIAGKQYFRSLYYSTNVLAALGKTIEPDSDVQYAIALIFMLSGFLITAIVVDNVQKRFTASAYEQKQFYGIRTKIQLFLRRQNAPDEIFQRVNSFLDFWWSSHRGAFISELIADLPAPMKLEILYSICNPALQTLGLLPGVRPVLDKLEEFFVTNAKFILYGQGEVVYRQGDYASGIFFLLEGDVCVIANAQNPRGVPQGAFFGSAVLRATEHSQGYGEHVSATKGCVLLFISRDHLLAMGDIFPAFLMELSALEFKLLRNKLMKTDMRGSSGRAERRHTVVAPAPAKQTFWGRLFDSSDTALDPDSKLMLLWETWLFLAMTVQWLAVTVQICFRMKKARYLQADIATAFLEISFFIDVYVRTRVGYYAFGNKIMDPRVIRTKYFRSKTFIIDVLSLTPLYAVNWFRPASSRLDSLNVNKIIRVLKVPGQLRALENRYLKRTTELRLFKLFYYTFLLAHMFACMWFDFASNASHILNLSSNDYTEFGADEWLPPADLEFAALNLQYFASIFWSFGLMSASSTGELPKTTHECWFSVMTMTVGFFLFAYVVGNFTDIIELADGDNKEFLERLSAIRILLLHFPLPKTIEDRLKTYYCFQRYHTITRERHLERILPPSLLTDLRLVHLKPMISKVSFLGGMEGSVTRMLVSQFHQVLVLREQYVCKYGEEGYDMFFVFTGVLHVLLPAEMVAPEEPNDWDQSLPEPAVGVCALQTDDPLAGHIKKVSELTSGSYFGENGLFTKSLRNAYVRASTSCILYKLSRDSLELVFDRYPQWKEKVLRIANLQHEQQKLARLSAEEQNRHSDESNGSMLSRIDLINRRAERMEEELQLVRIRRADSGANLNATQNAAKKLVVDRIKSPFVILWASLTVGAEAQSPTHRKWLWLSSFCTVFTAFIIPYRISIDPLTQMSVFGEVMKVIEVFCEVMFVVDVWFCWRVKECTQSMELYEQPYQLIYRRERMVWDLISAFPLDRLLTDFTTTPWLRLLHCAKIVNIYSYMDELNRRSVSVELNRFRGVCLLYGLGIYWAACSYLAISSHAGFGEEWSAWRPAKELEIYDDQTPSTKVVTLRMLRGLFYGTTSFVKKGKTFTPDTTLLYIFSVLMSFTGMLVMSFMVGEFASLYISYIWNEVDYRKNQIAVQLYLERLDVSVELKHRTQRFMSSSWSSHSGMNYDAVFADVPDSIRSAITIHIVQRPLRLFMSTTFRVLAGDSRSDLDGFTHMLAQNLRFEGYPRDEDVVSEGSISRAMFFVVRGHLGMASKSDAAIARTIIRKGQYFGDRGLIGCAVSTFTVRTIRASDLLSLSSERFLRILEENTFSFVALMVARRAQERLDDLKPPQCSRLDMETRWGETLLSELQQLKQSGRDRSSNGLPHGPQLSMAHVDKLAKSMPTVADCMRAFLPFLCLVLPFDPLDWDAAVGRTKAREARHYIAAAKPSELTSPHAQLGPPPSNADDDTVAALSPTPLSATSGDSVTRPASLQAAATRAPPDDDNRPELISHMALDHARLATDVAPTDDAASASAMGTSATVETIDWLATTEETPAGEPNGNTAAPLMPPTEDA